MVLVHVCEGLRVCLVVCLQDPKISLPDEYKAQEQDLQQESQQQNEILDQISVGLDVLLEGSRAMGSEVAGQGQQLQQLHTKTDAVFYGLRSNTREAARQVRN